MPIKALRESIVVLAVALAACSCQQEKASAPADGASDPRAALRALLNAIDGLDKEAFFRSLGKDPEGLEPARSFFTLFSESHAFEEKLVEAYGEKARTEYRKSLPGFLVQGTKDMLKAHARKLEDVPVVYEGSRAYVPAVKCNEWIRFNRIADRWFVDPASLFAFDTTWDRAKGRKFYDETVKHLKDATRKIGKKGVTAESLLNELEGQISSGLFPKDLIFRELPRTSREEKDSPPDAKSVESHEDAPVFAATSLPSTKR